MKRIITYAAALAATPALAQSQSADLMTSLYIVSALLVILFFLVIAVAVYTLRVIKLITRQIQGESAEAEQTSQSYWARWMEKLNRSVPVEAENEIILDHEYDGIRELDNHLPPWWKALFWGAIIWGVVYMIVYHVTDSLPLQIEEYELELARAEEQVRLYQTSQPKAVIDENTLEYTEDAEAIARGKQIYTTNACGGCHGAEGGGNTIGPNLADDYWLHGGEIKDVFRTIRDGVVEKGMPAWGKSMSAQDVKDVTFFVMSLRGTNPPNAKGPQGELVKYEPGNEGAK